MANAVLSVAIVILCITVVSLFVTSVLAETDACSISYMGVKRLKSLSFAEMVKHGGLKLIPVVPE